MGKRLSLRLPRPFLKPAAAAPYISLLMTRVTGATQFAAWPSIMNGEGNGNCAPQGTSCLATGVKVAACARATPFIHFRRHSQSVSSWRFMALT